MVQQLFRSIGRKNDDEGVGRAKRGSAAIVYTTNDFVENICLIFSIEEHLY